MLIRYIMPFLILCLIVPVSLSASVNGQMEIRRIPVTKGLASHPVNGGNCLISDGQYQNIARVMPVLYLVLFVKIYNWWEF